MPGDVLGQALNAARAIELLDGLGVDPRQSRQEMIDGLVAAGINMEPGTVIRGLVDALRPEREDPGQRLIDVDYSQIEMRLAAQFAEPVIPSPVPGGRALRYEASTRIRFGPAPARVAEATSFTCTLEKTKVDWGALAQAFEEPAPKKSVWEWLRNPAL